MMINLHKICTSCSWRNQFKISHPNMAVD